MKSLSKILLVVVALAMIIAACFATPDLVPTLGVCAVALVAVALCPSLSRDNLPVLPMANIAEGTHDGSITRLTDAAIATRHLLFSVGSDGNHIAVASASTIAQGTVNDEATAAEQYVGVLLLGKGPTKLMVANEIITAGEEVFQAAAGKVQDLPAGAGTYYSVGFAITASGADGDLIEVNDHTPRAVVVAG